ncbi:beta-ketoacyl synthase chain length factor [Acetobacter sp. TBRC 12305]|uniref:Beta-ketoacyl synthase chain length factor n=1 Tax=Acetobacter garciniae TaxID=2817435 RepID=A0A939HJW8_9PROT|nr:beta-ketoacyl synthase chain length factor [Acetobacter garciniae]MBO1324797.1 beta-ketoacyl synthase chain length factor [Acetobacter garciniae]MBX0344488.1 beta-ketoacyl synthase chain length factor [Acetobacter garciniae]
MRVVVRSASVWGPGLPGWARSVAVLRDPSLWDGTVVAAPSATALPPNERRRAGPVTRLALAVAQEACALARVEPSEIAALFSSANGDGGVIDAILNALCTPGADVSPTQFHNSVHNAPAGYWTISHGSIAPATAVSGFDWSFGQGLLKAAAEAVAEAHPVLFVAYDLPIPGPIGMVRVTQEAFACAFVLDPDPEAPGLATLSMTYDATTSEGDAPDSAAFRQLARGNPAACGLNLLSALARRDEGCIRVACFNGQLKIEVSPCLTAPQS